MSIIIQGKPLLDGPRGEDLIWAVLKIFACALVAYSLTSKCLFANVSGYKEF